MILSLSLHLFFLSILFCNKLELYSTLLGFIEFTIIQMKVMLKGDQYLKSILDCS